MDVSKYGPWAVVTGASAGIGACFADHLARDGLHVVLVARRGDKLREVAARLGRAYPRVKTLVVEADLAAESGVAAVAAATAGLDVGLLVNNAATEQVGSLWNVLPEKQTRVVDVNCRAPLALLLHYGNAMMERRRGGVINVSSRLSSGPSEVCPLYCASKAFVSTLSVGAAEQLKKHNVDVLVCQPGKTATDLVQRASLFNKGSAGAKDAMPVDTCVGLTLRELGRRQVVTLGWRAQLYVFVRRYFPTILSRYILDSSVLSLNAPRMQVHPYSARSD